MRAIFAPNITTAGRIARGLGALALLAGAAFAVGETPWLGMILAGLGLFTAFEALRGWCVLRACGIRTRL